MMKTKRKKRKSRAPKKKRRKKKRRPNSFSVGVPGSCQRSTHQRRGPCAGAHEGNRRRIQSAVLRALPQDGGIVEQRLAFQVDGCCGTGNSRRSACQSAGPKEGGSTPHTSRQRGG